MMLRKQVRVHISFMNEIVKVSICKITENSCKLLVKM